MHSVKLATKLQIIFATAKVTALLLVIGAASVYLVHGYTGELPKGFQNRHVVPHNILHIPLIRLLFFNVCIYVIPVQALGIWC